MKERKYPRSYSNEMFSDQAEKKRDKSKYYLENTIIAFLSFLAGCLVKRFLAGW